MWALQGVSSEVPQKSINPWSMKGERVLPALTFNYLRPGTAEPLHSHSHKRINTHTGASSHPCLLTAWLPDASNSHKLGIKPRESCPERLPPAPSSASETHMEQNGTKSLKPQYRVWGFFSPSCLISEQSFMTGFLTALEYSVLHHLQYVRGIDLSTFILLNGSHQVPGSQPV